MATLRSPLFLICLALFTIHQVMQKGLHIHFDPADRYLDNLLAMPVTLTLLLFERRWLFKKGNAYRLPLLDTIVATIYFTIIAEVLFPLLSKDFTADWKDIICYAIGSVLFYLVINRPQKR